MEIIKKKGWVYVMRNRQYRDENIRKIGMTNNPKRRLSEANRETYSPPEWYYEILKEVDDQKESEIVIHKILDLRRCRKYPEYIKKEFFDISYTDTKTILDIIPGTYYDYDNLPNTVENEVVSMSDENDIINTNDDLEESDKDEEITNDAIQNTEKSNSPRNMRDYFLDGTEIRHRLANDDTWLGVFNYTTNTIDREGEKYCAPTAFARNHWQDIVGIKSNRSGWSECYAKINNEWKKLNKLSKL